LPRSFPFHAERFGALLDELRQDAYCDFVRADGGDVQPDWACDAVKLCRRGKFLSQKLFTDDARLAPAADQTEKGERKMDPLRQCQRVVLMAARDDEAERVVRRTDF